MTPTNAEPNFFLEVMNREATGGYASRLRSAKPGNLPLVPEIHRLVLVEESRDGEPSRPARRMQWGADDLPDRSQLHAAVRHAYRLIGRSYFPSSAWVEITMPNRTERIEASEPEDEAMTASGLWNAIQSALLDYDSSN